MTESYLDPETLENIREARTSGGSLDVELLVEFENIGELLSNRVQETPDAPFLICRHGDGGERLEFSWRAFGEHTARLAAALEGMGVRRGDAVGVLSKDPCVSAILYAACWKLGAAAAAVDAESPAGDIQFAFHDAGAKVIFHCPASAEKMNEAKSGFASSPRIVGFNGAGRSPDAGFQAAFDGAPGDFEPREPAELDDDALILYGKRADGTASGISIPQSSLLIVAENIAGWHKVDYDQKLIVGLPASSAKFAAAGLMTPVYGGGCVVVLEFADAAEFWRAAAEERASVIFPPHDAIEGEEAETAISQCDLGGARHIVCDVDGLDGRRAARLGEISGLPVATGYGRDETAGYVAFLPVDLTGEERSRWLSAEERPSFGPALECNEIAIQKPDGSPAGPGEQGEIVLRGASVMKGYRNNPALNAQRFRGGWLHTGDAGHYRMDEQGRKSFYLDGAL